MTMEEQYTPGMQPPQPEMQPPQPEDEAEPLRVIAFDTQSICAQLFSKQLSNHLRLGRITHPYVLAATLGPERIHRDIGNEHTRSQWSNRAATTSKGVQSLTYESATNDLLRLADKLEKQEKTCFITEYPPFIIKHDIMRSAVQSKETVISRLENPTMIPDELLKLLTPIIFIQHPAIVLPAWLRLTRHEYGDFPIDEEDFAVWTSLRWSRMLFDYLRSSQHLKRQDSVHSNKSEKWTPGYVAIRPYVIDAEDVAMNTHAMLAATCRLLGIEFTDASQSWSRYFDQIASTFKKAIPSGLAHAFSSRLQDEPSSHINIESEAKSWEREFGTETAAVLRRRVDEEMVHYRYLKTYKVRILPSLTTAALRQNITGMLSRRGSATMATPEDLERESLDHPLRVVRSAITA